MRETTRARILQLYGGQMRTTRVRDLDEEALLATFTPLLPQGAAERARQMRFLAARGFSGEVVRRVLNSPPHGDASS